MEELKATFRVCAHIKSDGIRCNSPALTGLNFCYQHIGGTRSSLARARSTTSGTNARLAFVYPGDRAAIQHNLFLVAQALSEGKIDTVEANTYNRLFRTSDQNLHRWEKRNPNGGPLKPEGAPFKPAFGLSGDQETDGEQEPATPQPTTTEGAPSLPAAPPRERPGEQSRERPGEQSRESVGKHEPSTTNQTRPELTELEAEYFSGVTTLPPLPRRHANRAETWDKGSNQKPEPVPGGGPLKPAFGLSGEQEFRH